MKQQRNSKIIIVTAVMLFFISNIVMAQVSPQGNINITNYPGDRIAAGNYFYNCCFCYKLSTATFTFKQIAAGITGVAAGIDCNMVGE